MGYKGNKYKTHLVASKPALPFTPHEFESSVEADFKLPRVFFSQRALSDMFQIVDLQSEEVGWLGAVTRRGEDYLVDEVFVPTQRVHGATCELTADGIANLTMDILGSRDDGMEVVNSLRFWGHSHVQMGTAASAQDEQQFFSLAADANDFFIRAILNKKGRMQITIYLYSQGFLILDAEWGVLSDLDRRDWWEGELRAKVSRLTYTYEGKGSSVVGGLTVPAFAEHEDDAPLARVIHQ